MGKNIKIALASLIALLLLFPTNVMANDTRNRVLNQPVSINYQVSYNAQCDWGIFNRTLTSATYNANSVLNFKTTKNSVEITTPLEFKDFLPLGMSVGIVVGTSHIDLENHHLTGPGAIKAEFVYVNSGGLDFISKVNFTGSTNKFSKFDLFSDTGIAYTDIIPNTKYPFYFTPNIGSAKGQNFESTLIYPEDPSKFTRWWGYLRPSMGRVMGYARISSTTGDPYVPRASISSGSFYTAADDPSITLSNITTDTATISWNTNNTNPVNTSYTLQYQTLKANGNPQKETDWGTWTTIPIDGANTTTKLTTTSNVFQPDNTYRLRVQVNHVAGASYNVYSDYVIFSTSADPAVRAAQEAAIAAQAAKKAAEDSVQYSLDAKSAAEDVKGDVRHPEYGLEAISNKIYNSTPFIQKISNPDKASITLSNEFEIEIKAAGVQENLVYRVKCDSFDSGWTRENLIKIKGLNETGIKKAIITVSNNPSAPEKGATVEDEFTFFKAGFLGH